MPMTKRGKWVADLRPRFRMRDPALCGAVTWVPAFAGMTFVDELCTQQLASSPRRCSVPGDWLDRIGVARGVAFVRERLGPCM